MAGILDLYGYNSNGNGIVSIKEQCEAKQGAIDAAQDEKIAQNVEKIEELESSSGSSGTAETMIETTYDELVSLRDNSQLIPGCWYRITDYECTTSSQDTQSAGHPFDILVLATSVNTLSEEARAINHAYELPQPELQSIILGQKQGSLSFNRDSDSDYTTEGGDILYAFYTRVGTVPKVYNYYIYTYSLTDIPTNETVYQCTNDYHKIISDSQVSELTTVDNLTNYLFGEPISDDYFYKCNLSAWKIWYCLDNDDDRFDWADYSVGKGVVYRMIDEWNNDCPYDFKNIQFKRYEVTDAVFDTEYCGTSNNTAWLEDLGYTVNTENYIWAYTFSGNKGDNINDSTVLGTPYCSNNIIQRSVDGTIWLLPDVVFFGQCYDNRIGACVESSSITIIDGTEMTIGNSCYDIISIESTNYKIGDSCNGCIILETQSAFINDSCSNIIADNTSCINIGSSCSNIYLNGGPTTIGNACQNINWVEKSGTYNLVIESDISNIEVNEILSQNSFVHVGYNTSGDVCYWIPSDNGTPIK